MVLRLHMAMIILVQRGINRSTRWRHGEALTMGSAEHIHNSLLGFSEAFCWKEDLHGDGTILTRYRSERAQQRPRHSFYEDEGKVLAIITCMMMR